MKKQAFGLVAVVVVLFFNGVGWGSDGLFNVQEFTDAF